MSDVLSTLIAFVGVLIVLSSLVQSVQEALKNLLNLKRGAWERFFFSLYRKELLIEREDKGELPQSPPLRPMGLWKGRTGGFIGEFDKRMARLKDAVVAADGMIKDLKGVLTAIGKIDPTSPDLDRQIAELGEPMNKAVARITALKLDSLLDVYEKLTDGRIRRFYDSLKEFEKGRSIDVTAKGEKALSDLQRGVDDLLKSIASVERAIGEYRLMIEQRLDAWLAQLNEEYRRNMLKWTVVIGAVIVVVFNADAYVIYRYLSVHDQAKVVLSGKAEGLADPGLSAKTDGLNEADALIRQKKAEEAKGVLIALSDAMEKDFDAYGKVEKAKRAAALRKETEGVNVEGKQALARLKEKAGDLAVLFVDLQKLSIDSRIDTLLSLELPLGWGEDWKKITTIWEVRDRGTRESLVSLGARKLGGLTLTTFLITFGAPFWNDIVGALAGIKNEAVKKGRAA